MRRALSVVLAPLLLAAGCARTEVRFAPSSPAYALAPEHLAPVSALVFKDSSGGVRSEGTGVLLKRPFFDAFREAVVAQFGALKVPMTLGTGSEVEVELTRVGLKRGSGFFADLNATVAYALNVRSAGETICRPEVTGWSTVGEGVVSSPAGEALSRALAKAMDDLGPALAASCLYLSRAPAPGAPAAAAPARDAKAWALIVGIGRGPGKSGADDARAAAEYAKTALGVPDDQVVLIVDEMATLAALQKHVERWLPARAGPDHKVFAAFFVPGAAAGGGTLLPFDGDPDAVAETGYPLSRLYAALGRLPARATVVLGPDVPAPKTGRVPASVSVLRAGRDPRAALDAAKAGWGGR